MLVRAIEGCFELSEGSVTAGFSGVALDLKEKAGWWSRSIFVIALLLLSLCSHLHGSRMVRPGVSVLFRGEDIHGEFLEGRHEHAIERRSFFRGVLWVELGLRGFLGQGIGFLAGRGDWL